MIPKKLLTILVYSLPVLIVVFAVLAGGYLLSGSTGDTGGSKILLRLGWVCGGLIAVDALLLLIALGVRALESEQNNDPS